MTWSDLLLDHFDRPRNAGEVERPDAAASVRDPEKGDILAMSFRLESGRIVEARFRAYGCPATIAAGSWATGRLVGRTVQEALLLDDEEVSRALGSRSWLVGRVIRAAFAPPESSP